MSVDAVVSEKGQVTLPKRLRDQLGIQPGSRLAFSVGQDGVLRAEVLASGSASLFGLLSKKGEKPRSLRDMDEGVARAVGARAGIKK